MKVTGYKLQYALKELEQSRDVAAGQFGDNIMQFESQEEKPDLKELFASYTALERSITKVQVAQATYNLGVTVTVLGENMSLHEAVKLVGGAGRAEKMWRDIVKGQKCNRYYAAETTRAQGVEYAKRAVSTADAMAQAKQAARVAGALRQAIQLGNATELEVEGLDPTLFES